MQANLPKELFFMQQGKIKKTDPDTRYRAVLAASTLEGNEVRNSAGDDLGKIDEIMIHIPTGRIAYAVLSFGGFLGMGNKLFAVPWSKLRVDEDEKCFILEVNKQTLENAPGFDKNDWPDMTDTVWGSGIYSYYEATPYWEEAGRKTLHGGGGL
jgi:sporulation protein YlmC with PRC-barrel domain